MQPAKIVDGYAVSDIDRDILKFAHGGTTLGPAAISAWDSSKASVCGVAPWLAQWHMTNHNLAVIGVDDVSMKTAVKAIAEMGGGLVLTDGTQVLASLSLPIAGLLSDQPIEEVRRRYDHMIHLAHELGNRMDDPFMVMSFMGLEVIPKLKLTDLGLVDVEQFKLVKLFV